MKNKQSFTRTLITCISVVPVAAFLMMLNSCGGPGNLNAYGVDTTKGLKDFYKDYFPIGVAVAPSSLEGAQAELIKKNFNSLTPENVMKPGPIHPEENRYFWDDADKIVEFAQANGMKVRGHTLCWHSQTAGRARAAPR